MAINNIGMNLKGDQYDARRTKAPSLCHPQQKEECPLKPELLIMAVIGAMIGEGVRKDSSLLEVTVVINIAASAFLAYLAAYGLMSLGSFHEGIIVSLSGLLGYLGDQYSKGWLLKALKRYEMGEMKPTEGKRLKEKAEDEGKQNKKNTDSL